MAAKGAWPCLLCVRLHSARATVGITPPLGTLPTRPATVPHQAVSIPLSIIQHFPGTVIYLPQGETEVQPDQAFYGAAFLPSAFVVPA